MFNIGLVDDDLSVRRAVCRLLRTHGYGCSAYESGEAALADPLFLQMDCLILDVQLSGMNGFEIRDRLRALGSPLPHIFITAHAQEQSADWHERLGNSLCLTKPFEEAELISRIKQSLFKQRT